MKKAWLSAHLYYNEPWETFLRKAILPYIETVLKTGVAESYFFIRYWEKGPHLRLRFRGEAGALEAVLKPNLKEHFKAYFEANPSVRQEPEYPADFPAEHKWNPNNEVCFETYLPEVNRYGGKTALAICEQQFQLSSFVVLDHFREGIEQDDYHAVLGIAMRLHLGFVHSLGLGKSMRLQFFKMIFENWLPKAFEILEHQAPEALVLERIKETIDLFEQSFEEQKEMLIDFHQNLLEELSHNHIDSTSTYGQWLDDNKELGKDLIDSLYDVPLNSRPNLYALPDELKLVLSETECLCWNIWADQVHMTNNRLGVINQDEAYLAYLTMRSLEELEKSTSDTNSKPV